MFKKKKAMFASFERDTRSKSEFLRLVSKDKKMINPSLISLLQTKQEIKVP